MTQADVEPVRHHHEPRRDLFAGRERDALALAAYRDVIHLGGDECDVRGNLAAHRVDHRVVENAVLVARPLLDEPAEARHPGFAVERCGAQHGVGDAGLAQNGGLGLPSIFSGAKVRRIDLMGIDQHDRMAGAAQHCGCERARKPAARDQDVGLPHLRVSSLRLVCT